VKEKFSGKFIVLDGPDGCGKTTQTKLLVRCLQQKGVDVATFREPGGTAIGEKIRQILLNPDHIAMSTTACGLQNTKTTGFGSYSAFLVVLLGL
jgi:thymidylate kinase